MNQVSITNRAEIRQGGNEMKIIKTGIRTISIIDNDNREIAIGMNQIKDLKKLLSCAKSLAIGESVNDKGGINC